MELDHVPFFKSLAFQFLVDYFWKLRGIFSFQGRGYPILGFLLFTSMYAGGGTFYLMETKMAARPWLLSGMGDVQVRRDLCTVPSLLGGTQFCSEPNPRELSQRLFSSVICLPYAVVGFVARRVHEQL